ncbi:MAG: GtrA family protein [Erysipelotrichaceae bacterium]|nr:GtrA family protein [Erysipelotrichaceae bacterium]
MKKIKELFLKYKEVISYLFFGGCTFLVSIISFYIFNKALSFNEHISNIISWILAVAFAFVTNKVFVFESKAKEKKTVIKELISFVTARLLTLGIEEIILFVGCNLLNIDALIVKIIAQVVVIVSNYFLSKLFIFKK